MGVPSKFTSYTRQPLLNGGVYNSKISQKVLSLMQGWYAKTYLNVL